MTDLEHERLDEDVDMELPNDEEDMHKIIQKRRKHQELKAAEIKSELSLSSSQK